MISDQVGLEKRGRQMNRASQRHYVVGGWHAQSKAMGVDGRIAMPIALLWDVPSMNNPTLPRRMGEGVIWDGNFASE